MFIRTERLFLRPCWPEDLDDVIAAMADDALPLTVAEFREYLSQPRQGGLPHLFIYLREDGDDAPLIGGIGLGLCGAEVELGYWICPEHRGKGYATEAVRAVLSQASLLGHREIIAENPAENEALARVMAQSGFKPTGEPRSRNALGGGAKVPSELYKAVRADDRSGAP